MYGYWLFIHHLNTKSRGMCWLKGWTVNAMMGGRDYAIKPHRLLTRCTSKKITLHEIYQELIQPFILVILLLYFCFLHIINKQVICPSLFLKLKPKWRNIINEGISSMKDLSMYWRNSSNPKHGLYVHSFFRCKQLQNLKNVSSFEKIIAWLELITYSTCVLLKLQLHKSTGFWVFPVWKGW